MEACITLSANLLFLKSDEWPRNKYFSSQIFFFLARARESFLFFSNWVVSLLNSCHCTCFEWVGNCSNLILCYLTAIESNMLGMGSGYWKLNIGVLGISRKIGLRKILFQICLPDLWAFLSKFW